MGRHRRPKARDWNPLLAVATLATALVGVVGVVIAFRGSEAERDTVKVEAGGNDIAKRAAEEQERINRANLDRDRKRYASMVSVETVEPSSLGPQFIDGENKFRIVNRAAKGITSLELLASHDAAVGGDGVLDGMVSLSTSQGVPGCTAVTFALPAGFDLADIEGGVLRGQRLHTDDLTLLFFQDSVHWQFDPATGALAGEGDAGYSVRRNTMKTDAGQLVHVGAEALEDCLMGE